MLKTTTRLKSRFVLILSFYSYFLDFFSEKKGSYCIILILSLPVTFEPLIYQLLFLTLQFAVSS